MSPPTYYPPDLEFCFAADTFDKRFRYTTAGRELTPLGAVINAWYWYRENQAACGPAFKPIAATLEATIKRECPDQLEQLK